MNKVEKQPETCSLPALTYSGCLVPHAGGYEAGQAAGEETG